MASEQSYQQATPPIYSVTGHSITNIPPPVAGQPVTIEPPPPPYALCDTDITEPLPTYESLFGKVKAAKSKSTGVVDFLMKFVYLLAGTLFFTVTIGVVMAVPIAMIVIGAIHLHDCPAQKYIPIFLVVGGSFWSLICAVALLKRCFCETKEEETSGEEKKKSNPFETIIEIFKVFWFLTGNYWVYSTNDNYSTVSGTSDYCDQTLYLFAFWVITSVYILLGVLCCCLLVAGSSAAKTKS